VYPTFVRDKIESTCLFTRTFYSPGRAEAVQVLGMVSAFKLALLASSSPTRVGTCGTLWSAALHMRFGYVEARNVVNNNHDSNNNNNSSYNSILKTHFTLTGSGIGVCMADQCARLSIFSRNVAF
jgi:hypothetical protein